MEHNGAWHYAVTHLDVCGHHSPTGQYVGGEDSRCFPPQKTVGTDGSTSQGAIQQGNRTRVNAETRQRLLVQYQAEYLWLVFRSLGLKSVSQIFLIVFLYILYI